MHGQKNIKPVMHVTYIGGSKLDCDTQPRRYFQRITDFYIYSCDTYSMLLYDAFKFCSKLLALVGQRSALTSWP